MKPHFALCAAAACLAANPCHGETRRALIIGNGGYSGTLPKLANPLNDARVMQRVLEGLNFAVTLKTDLDLASFETVVRDFARTIAAGDTAFFFYAGHGMQANGQNYLLPLGAAPQTAAEVKHKCYDMQLVLDELEDAKAGLKVVVLDCCRDNPIGRGLRSSRVGTGLAKLGAVEGTIIAYSTSPGQTAEDGRGENSPFTAALAAVLASRPEGGLEIIDAFRTASARVKAEVQQIPWLNFEASLDRYFLTPGGGNAIVKPNVPPPVPSEMKEEAKAEPKPAEPKPEGRPAAAVATKERPFVNSLGLEFVPIPGTGNLMCRTETRVKDFMEYAVAVNFHQTGGVYVMRVNGGEGALPSPGLEGEGVERDDGGDPNLRTPSGIGDCGNAPGLDRDGPGAPREGPEMEKEDPGLSEEELPLPKGDSRTAAPPGRFYPVAIVDRQAAGYTAEWVLDDGANWANPGFVQADDHPVVGVSWKRAKDFCVWLSQKEGRSYRLPTDAEWSAAVGISKYPWGAAEPVPANGGNYFGTEAVAGFPGGGWKTAGRLSDGFERTAPVGQFAQNKYGFFDLGGNVWEWLEDEYRTTMNTAEAQETFPILKVEVMSDGTRYRTARGASWRDFEPMALRSATRNTAPPEMASDHNGFRLVLVLAAEK